MKSSHSKTYSALVVVGSANEERAFGITSGQRVAQALKNRGWSITVADAAQKMDLIKQMSDKQFDLVVPVGFGLNSPEDGTIFTVAKFFGIPCAGPGPFCGAVCTDKSIFQSVVRGIFDSADSNNGRLYVRTPNTFLVSRFASRDALEKGIQSLPLPLVLKPAYGGSSIGILIAGTYGEAIEHANKVKESTGRLLVQELISAREISSTIIDMPDHVHLCPLVELEKRGSLILDYDAKFGVSATSRHMIPAPFPPDITDAVKRIVSTLHSAIGFCGVTRVDALIDEDKSEMIVLEANPIAGMLESSIATDAARADGIDFETLAEAYALTAFRVREEVCLL
jgi:D-alanine-D-alanine ligase